MPPQGTPLTIFSHPGGRPLEWSRTCSLLGPGNGQFGYQCDTQGGPDQEAPQRAGVRYLVAEPGRFEHERLLLFAGLGAGYGRGSRGEAGQQVVPVLLYRWQIKESFLSTPS